MYIQGGIMSCLLWSKLSDVLVPWFAVNPKRTPQMNIRTSHKHLTVYALSYLRPKTKLCVPSCFSLFSEETVCQLVVCLGAWSRWIIWLKSLCSQHIVIMYRQNAIENSSAFKYSFISERESLEVPTLFFTRAHQAQYEVQCSNFHY